MSAAHTQGLLQHNHLDFLQICDTDGEVRGCAPVARIAGGKNGETRAEARANARRLVACWNAFDGTPTELIESVDALGSATMPYRLLQKSHTDLIEALDILIGHVAHYASMPHAHPDAHRDAATARAAIAKATQP